MNLHHEIQGRTVTLPVEVRLAKTAAATFRVHADAAERLLGGADLEVARISPRMTLMSLAAIDYRDNDLGDYDEVSITLFVRPKGERVGGIPYLKTWTDLASGRLGTFIYKLPVNQAFTCEAGARIWGFPKTVEEINVDYSSDVMTTRLAMDGEEVLTMRAPCVGTKPMPEMRMATYTLLDGALHRTMFTQVGANTATRLGGASVELGSHPIADQLRSLGLPKRPLFTMWNGAMRGTFEAPEKL